ncbi:MAG: MobC family plasmid mobilization relaxosome protein [Xanthobacteraceae bacterium]|nr:MobC family plasmid mobilization relaxosome protein [Xanthobacteraceae bacterium]
MRASRRKDSRPFSVRFTPAEKEILLQRAGSLPLGTFLRSAALGAPSQSRQRRPVGDSAALGRLLGLVGQSRLANNLNQLAKAAHIGSLPVTTETEDDLKAACKQIAHMRDLLLAALGMKPVETSYPDSLSPLFANAAEGDGR